MSTGVSIIIPVYNEEELIEKNTERLLEYLGRLTEKHEIILCDNGSTDDTKLLGSLLEARYPGRVKFLSLPKKGVVGLAFRQGVKAAKYQNIISMDMDLSVNLTFIQACMKLLKTNSIVVGSKQVGSQYRPLFRIIASSVYIFLVRLLLGLSFTDYSMGAKGFRKEDILGYIDKIDKGSAYVIELVYWLKKSGKRITEIPVVCFDRRKSKFNFLDECLYRLRSLITIWLFKKGK